MGLNGLYKVVALVNGLGPTHDYECDDYHIFPGIASGNVRLKWQHYCPARFDAHMTSKRIKDGVCPKRVSLDESVDDQLVPVNQLEKMKTQLEQVA